MNDTDKLLCGLENDIDFDNANQYNKNIINSTWTELNSISDENFTCVNREEMYSMYKLSKEVNKFIFNLQNKDCYCSKPFFRFKLQKNITELEINKFLQYLSNTIVCLISYDKFFCYKKIVDVKLSLIFLICNKLLQPIKLFDVKKIFRRKYHG
jgi:hypothetical protein